MLETFADLFHSLLKELEYLKPANEGEFIIKKGP